MMSTPNKIRHIVKLREMLRLWRKKSATRASQRYAPSDVPSGHVAVRVGTSCKRYIVHASYLNHPVFKKLLILAEEEYGFANTGPLVIPCEEMVFEEILRFLSNTSRDVDYVDFSRYCHIEFWSESRPLLINGLNEKQPVW